MIYSQEICQRSGECSNLRCPTFWSVLSLRAVMLHWPVSCWIPRCQLNDPSILCSMGTTIHPSTGSERLKQWEVCFCTENCPVYDLACSLDQKLFEVNTDKTSSYYRLKKQHSSTDSTTADVVNLIRWSSLRTMDKDLTSPRNRTASCLNLTSSP